MSGWPITPGLFVAERMRLSGAVSTRSSICAHRACCAGFGSRDAHSSRVALASRPSAWRRPSRIGAPPRHLPAALFVHGWHAVAVDYDSPGMLQRRRRLPRRQAQQIALARGRLAAEVPSAGDACVAASGRLAAASAGKPARRARMHIAMRLGISRSCDVFDSRHSFASSSPPSPILVK